MADRDFDPLTPPSRPSLLDRDAPASGPTATSPVGSLPSTPHSFKRRTASKSNGGISGGLLTSILNRGQEEGDLLPPSPAKATPSARAREASAMSAFTNALGSDDEDEAGQSGLGLGVPRLRPKKSTGNHRISFGGDMSRPKRDTGMLSPGGSGFYKRRSSVSPGESAVSPGGGESDEEGETVVDVTPLPWVPLLVLCICMFGEFLSASLSSPFLYFMIEDFGVGQEPGGKGEAEVGAWCGIVSSVFFLSQFLTSLLWVSVAEKHGRRAVLFSSLLGNGLTLMAFGTSKNLKSAIAIRLGMGLFNGAVGVARSAVGDITDSTNSGRAYTLMGLAWGLGGIVGSVIGGMTENPVRNWPMFFGESELFAEYPYLLPCLIAGSVTLFGALLSLFLSPDGGPREGRIRLPNEKDVERARGTFSSIVRRSFGAVKACLFRSKDAGVALGPTSGTPPPLPSPLPSPTTERGDVDPSRAERNPLAARRASNKYGTGYGPPPSVISRAGGALDSGMRIPSLRRRSNYRTASVMTGATSTRYAPDFEFNEGGQSFAQRFLLANKGATFNLAELWVANKTREADDGDYSVEYEDSVFGPTTEGITEEEGNDSRFSLGEEDHTGEPDFRGFGSAVPSLVDLRAEARRQDSQQQQAEAGPSTDLNALESAISQPRQARVFSGASVGGGRFPERLQRRMSIASSARGGPSIYSNTGLDAQTLAAVMSSPRIEHAQPDFMAAIPEGRAPSVIDHDEVDLEAAQEPVSHSNLIWQLPLGVIAQYGLVALHGTSCDQVFLSFIVTPISSGGLGLKASDYAGLIATMFFFSMVWQFKFYPNVGPPNGPFSHLAMFRIGLCLYLPVYLLFPQLRGLLPKNGGEGKAYVMFGMTLLSSMRYLASCCAYTAVMVLVNALSPPDLIPLANGIGQTMVSFCRFIGPLIGGAIWSASISGEVPQPTQGFYVVAAMCFTGLVLSLRIK